MYHLENTTQGAQRTLRISYQVNLALRTRGSPHEIKLIHYRTKLLLLNAKKVYSFLTGLLNKCFNALNEGESR
jgi:hypothetical protein